MNRNIMMAAGAAALMALAVVLLLKGRQSQPGPSAIGEEKRPGRDRPTEVTGGEGDSSERQARAAWVSGMMQTVGELASKRQEKLAARLGLTPAQRNQLQKGMQASVARMRGRLDECASAGEMKEPGILLYDKQVRVGEPGDLFRPLLSAEQLRAYEELIATENRSQQEAGAARNLAGLLAVLDDVTPGQREAAYQTFMDHGNPGLPDIFDDRFFQKLPEMNRRQPALEELRGVLTEEQFQHYSEKAAMWR